MLRVAFLQFPRIEPEKPVRGFSAWGVGNWSVAGYGLVSLGVRCLHVLFWLAGYSAPFEAVVLAALVLEMLGLRRRYPRRCMLLALRMNLSIQFSLGINTLLVSGITQFVHPRKHLWSGIILLHSILVIAVVLTPSPRPLHL
jgi:hypothetical protein